MKIKIRDSYYEVSKILETFSRVLTPERIHKIENILSKKTLHICLLMEELYDWGNIQALLRTSEGLGIVDVGYVPYRGNLKIKQYTRISKGTQKWLRLESFENIEEAIRYFQEKNYLVVATSLQAKESFYDLDFSRPITILLGNENDGITPIAEKLADKTVYFPMYGFVESFNVSSAGAMMLHHIRFVKEKLLGLNISLSGTEKEELKALYFVNACSGKSRETLLRQIK